MKQIHFHATKEDWDELIVFARQHYSIRIEEQPEQAGIKIIFPDGGVVGGTRLGVGSGGALGQHRLYDHTNAGAYFDALARYIRKIGRKEQFGYVLPGAAAWHDAGNKFAEEIPIDAPART